MTAEQLRNSILQEAISGRLVPQDPNDEPASVLLDRIVAEQNKTLPPKKKKSVSLIAEPEDITPVSGWAYFYIKDLFDTTSGGTPIKGHPEYYDGDIPWVRSGELNSLYLYDSELRITEAGLKNSSAKYFPVDTVVIAMYGATIGKTSIFKRSMTTNQAICGIFPIDGILPEYIYYFLQNKKRDYCSIAFGSGQPNISQEKIKNTIFPLPPLAEQKRIVAKLEELLPIVEQYGKAQKELDELNAALPARLRQSILQEAIQGKLVPQDPNDEPAAKILNTFGVKTIESEEDIPAGWSRIRMGEATEFINGLAFKPEEWKEAGLPIVRIQNLSNPHQPLHYTDKEIPEKFIIDDGQLLFSWSATLDAFIWNRGKACLNQHIFKLVPQPFIDKIYLYYLLKAIVEEYKKVTHGSTMKHITKGIFENYEILLPPLAEQQRIVAKIEELFEQIDKITK